MNNNKICKKVTNPLCVDLLFSLSEKELKNCASIISCNYFNTDRFVESLFLTLVKHLINPDRVYNDALKILIYNKVFNPGKKIIALKKEEDALLRAKYSALTKVVLEFLSIQALREHKTYQDDLVFSGLLQKQQYKLIQRRLNNTKRLLKKVAYNSTEFHRHYYVIEQHLLNFNRLTGLFSENNNFEALNKHLDTSFLIDKLKIYISMLTSQGATKNKYEVASMEVIEKLVNLAPYKSHVTIQLYWAAITLIKKQSEKEYYRFLKLLSDNSKQLPKSEIEGLYDVAANFCTIQIRLGNFDYKSLFDLYQLMHNNNFLIKDDLMDENTLKNVITVCCRTAEFEWAEELVDACFPFLRKPIRVSVQNYNSGVIAFYRKDYNKAHYYFSKVYEINNNYDLNNRVMLSKTFYETDKYYDWPTFTHFTSEQKFFSRNKKLKSSISRGYKNFFVILKDVYRIKHGTINKSIIQLQEKINKMNEVVDRTWLLSKIDELNKIRTSMNSR